MYASKLYPSHEKRAIRLENKTLPPNNSKELYHTRPRIILENDQTSPAKKKEEKKKKKRSYLASNAYETFVRTDYTVTDSPSPLHERSLDIDIRRWDWYEEALSNGNGRRGEASSPRVEKDGYRKGYHACTTRRAWEREIERGDSSCSFHGIRRYSPYWHCYSSPRFALSLFLSLWSVRLPFAGSLDLVRAHESHTAVADAGHRQSCRVSIG